MATSEDQVCTTVGRSGGHSPVEIPSSLIQMLMPGLWRTACAVVALAILPVGLVAGEADVGLVLLGVLVLAYAVLGVLVLVAATRWRGRPALRFDAEGILGRDGSVSQTWSDLVEVVVARRSWWSGIGPRPMEISCYSHAGLDFARRAGTRVHPKRVVSVPTAMDAGTVSMLIRSVTKVPVVVDEPARRLLQRER